MSNKNSFIEETKTLLETVQKEVLKEICSEKNLFEKIFKNDKPESLKQIQSSVAKALDQIKNFSSAGSDSTAKLQTHLNEKNQIIKDLETKLNDTLRENTLLRDQLNFHKKQLEKVLANQTENVSIEQEFSKSKDDLRKEFEKVVENLEEEKKALQKRYDFSQEELDQSQKLSDELSKRLKRLKSEIITL